MYKVDLTKCKKGDVLISTQGNVLFYKDHEPELLFPHIIEFLDPKLGEGSRSDDGQVFMNNKLPTDDDVFLVIKKEDIDMSTIVHPSAGGQQTTSNPPMACMLRIEHMDISVSCGSGMSLRQNRIGAYNMLGASLHKLHYDRKD